MGSMHMYGLNRNDPRGLNTSNALFHLGYPKDVLAQEESLVRTISAYWSEYVWYEDSRLFCCQMPNGIQLWQEWNPNEGVCCDISPHFFTHNGLYLKPDNMVRYCQPGMLVRSAFLAEARSKMKQEQTLARNMFASPNLSIFTKKIVQEEVLVAQVTAFPLSLICYKNAGEYRQRRKNRLHEESFVSGFGVENNTTDEPAPEALITGTVKSVTVITNDITDQPFYHIAMGCLGMVVDVVVNPVMFDTVPLPGMVIQGVFQLSARILDYGYDGGIMEMYIVNPLTSSQFEPIRSILSTLQPGGKIACYLRYPMDGIAVIRAKGEVEGISVEFRLETSDRQEEHWRFLRFYPLKREMAIKIFERSLIYRNPPQLDNAEDVTHKYQQ